MFRSIPSLGGNSPDILVSLTMQMNEPYLAINCKFMAETERGCE